VRELIRLLAAAAVTGLCLAGMALGWSCAEGDDDPPGAVGDLFYFFDADAMGFNGRVYQAGTQAEPADTRVLAWTAPGDDGFDGEAALYDIRYLKQSDVPAGANGAAWLAGGWASARELVNEPEPATSGRIQQLLIPRLDPGETVWFGVKVFDEIGQVSKLGQIAGPIRIRRLAIPVRTAAATAWPNFGLTLDQAGDLNADGLMDFVIGSPDQGRAQIFLGMGSSGLMTLAAPNPQGIYVYRTIDEIVPAFTVKGAVADEFASVVAGAGLVNSDSFFDLAIGAPGLDAGIDQDVGRVYFQLGGAMAIGSSVDAAGLIISITGDEAWGRFGHSICSGGDWDADMRSEIVVGAPGAAGGAGKAYVFAGSDLGVGDHGPAEAKATVIGENAGDEFGAVVANIGDVNGDGVDDVAVGAPGYDWGSVTDGGAVYVFYGGLGLISAGAINLSVDQADVTILGSANGRRFGKAIVAGGALADNLDASEDFAVVGGETVYVYFGGLSGAVQFPQTSVHGAYQDGQAAARLHRPGEGFGADIAGPGDMNHDGYAELVVGAPGANACYIYRGQITAATSGMFPDETITAAAGSSFCAVVAGPGDVNLDGHTDLLIADPAAGVAYYNF